MDISSFFSWLHDLPLAETIRESDYLFPSIESLHVIAITLVVGTVAVVDLRLLGVTSNKKPVTELAVETLPWTWIAFCIAVVSGLLLFISKATIYVDNWPFRLKMLFIALAGLNMMFFELRTIRSVPIWDRNVPAITAAKVAGMLSLTFWILVVAFARWIGFTIQG